jgi:hypothetical protein
MPEKHSGGCVAHTRRFGLFIGLFGIFVRLARNQRIPTTAQSGTASRLSGWISEAVSGYGRQIGLVIALLLLMQREQLLPIDGHIARSFDTQTDLATINIYDRDADIIADVNLFPELATEY